MSRIDLCDIPTVLHRREADIDSLVCWRIAELRALGVDARVECVWLPRPSGGQVFTLRVRLPNGEIEDVQRLLGGGR